MEIRAIRYFLAAAETENLSRASERLNIVQSALSHQIRGLENELGVELFVRHGRRIRLSPAGKVFLEDARKVVAAMDRSKLRVARAARGAVGELRVGFETISSRNRLVSEALLAFRARHPEVTLELAALTAGPLLDAVREGEVDAGFVHMLTAFPELETITFETTDWLLALPRNHRLVRKEVLWLKDLEGEPFVWRPRNVSSAVYDRLLAACRAVGFAPNIVQEAHSEMMINLVSVGLGVCFLVENMAPLHTPGDLVVFRKVQDFSIPLELCLAWRRDNASASLPHLIDIVRRLSAAGAAPAPKGLDAGG
jgi:DNA-binding transcriptional LysR family regulator